MKTAHKAWLYLLFSMLVVFLAQYIKIGLIYLDILYAHVSLYISPIFSNSGNGAITRTITILTIMPLMMSGPPALLYRFVKKKPMPYFFELTWFFWLVLVLSKMLF